MRVLGIVFAGALALLCRPALALDAEAAGSQGSQRAVVSPENLALATRHFDEATRLYGAGKYDEARIEFEASFALTREAELLHNISLAAERQGKLSDAIDFEERFLAAKPPGMTQRDSDEARGRIARLREQQLRVTSGPPLAAASDRAVTPATERRRVPPGAIGLLAIGGAAVAVGVGCGAGAWATARTIDNMPLTLSDVNALTARGQALDRAGIALDLIGAASLVAGTAWAVVDRLRGSRTVIAGTSPQTTFALVW